MSQRLLLALIPVAATSLLAAGPVEAAPFIDLTAGKKLLAKDSANPRADKIVVKLANEPNLHFLPESPLCPTQSSVRFVSSAQVHPEQVLDCNGWELTGTGFRYREEPGGAGSLRKISYRPGRLSLTFKGAPYSDAPIAGPVSFIETRIQIGSTTYCGRWSQPPGAVRKNTASKVLILGPTGACQTDCGNGIPEAPEQCDDGNGDVGDGCRPDCSAESCGDTIVDPLEDCDDGNDDVGDGCRPDCSAESCGDTIVDPQEDCDDGNATSGDGCDTNCTVTACGNGIQTGSEDCDDGNDDVGDGCRPDCSAESCGDTIVDPLEDCDDGNLDPGDCCSASCAFEGNGSPCTDDGNLCTDDECDGVGTCQHPDNSASCTDGDGCTSGDVCAGGACSGELLPPWINEVDYDDFFGVLDDRDEFVEIAGPAGTDLSGYTLIAVEGGNQSPCLTPHLAPFPAVGEAHFSASLPNGSVLGDDTGSGIGFLVACFINTSINVANLPACDVILPAPRLDSNLMNGHLVNTDQTTCPDGVLLLDSTNGYVDSFSYEGVVPSVGTYGPLFHVFPAYSAPRDEGWLAGVSIEKTSSTTARAASASEWRDPSEVGMCVAQQGTGCVALSRTPGAENPTQILECGSPHLAFLESSSSLLD